MIFPTLQDHLIIGMALASLSVQVLFLEELEMKLLQGTFVVIEVQLLVTLHA